MLMYTLPTLQLVCHLVHVNNTNSGTIQLPSTTTTTTTTPRPPLPSGYVAYPKFEVAYKVYKDKVSWNEAKDRCSREGAYLAEIDSTEKIQVVKDQVKPWFRWLHVGLHFNNDDQTWYRVNTGLPVYNMPWGSGEPNGDGLCSLIIWAEPGLGKFSCEVTAGYVCQIPLH